MRRIVLRQGTWAACAALAWTGCLAPKITAFEVEPHALCAGDAAVARWDVRGAPELTVQLDDPRLSTAAAGAPGESPPPGPDGSHVVGLRLTARIGAREAAATRWILQYPAQFEDEIALPGRPAPEGVVATGDKSAARWGDRFEVAAVAAPDGRALEVVHAGLRAALAADGTPSTALAGTPLEGAWELTWRGPAGPSAPEALRLRAIVRCRRTP